MTNMKKGDAPSLPKGWEIKRLGDVCYSKSSNVSQNQLADEVGDYPIFGASGLIKNISFYHRDKPYLSIVKDGSGFGRITKMEAFTSVIGTLQYILPNDEIDLDYLNYSLMSVDFKKYVQGAAIPHIYFKDYKNEPFLWMPLPEQQRIVAILDEAFAAIAKAKDNAEQNLKNSKELFESYLQNVFENKGEGWEEKTLGQISKTFGRGKSKHRPRNFSGLYGGVYPFIQTGNVRNCNHYITEYTQTYNEVGLAQSKLWPAGTICITIAANIAETGVLSFDACFPDSVIGIVVDEKFADRDFVEYLLQSFKVRIVALGKGAAQANINLGTFENELFPFPSIKVQQAIVQKLDALSAETKKLEAIYQQKINDLEELKKSVLQKAFSGELTSPSSVLKKEVIL
ncbi:MAG: restriction endonuclease subunit S [Lutibacter sp.]|nr:restriction endonuclease subunit S [Lutibacter sp.]